MHPKSGRLRARIGDVRTVTAALGMGRGLWAALAISLCALVGSPQMALALCTGPSAGGVENCTGNLSGAGTVVFANPSPAINDLEVTNVTTGPSQVVLSGVGASVDPGDNAVPG